MRGAALLAMAALAAVACEGADARKARLAAESRARVDAATAQATAAASRPVSYLWDAAQLTKHLVDAGLAPQRIDTVHALPWMGVPVVAFRLGDATLHAYVFHDSTARKAVAARLDPATLAPAGVTPPWGQPRELVENGNLLGVVIGGTDRQRDRITTALAAGAGPP
ncbi:MAG TPA: hypothetical protein VG916_09675 [Gemmatimonadaceae bacterium]|nr:hypothetical protein [Gemmatimonadaceae bacterium]